MPTVAPTHVSGVTPVFAPVRTVSTVAPVGNKAVNEEVQATFVSMEQPAYEKEQDTRTHTHTHTHTDRHKETLYFLDSNSYKMTTNLTNLY